MKRLRGILDLVGAVAMLLAAVMVIWHFSTNRVDTKTTKEERPPFENVSDKGFVTTIANLPTRGDVDAPLVIVEFGDFQCPYCGRHARETFPVLDRELIMTGKVRYAFANFPLERIHPFAMAAARAADCAQRQGRFWEAHSFFYAGQSRLDTIVGPDGASDLGVKSSEFKNCLAQGDDARLRAQIAEASKLGVASTPTFIIGTAGEGDSVKVIGKIFGARPYAVFKDVLNGLLKS